MRLFLLLAVFAGSLRAADEPKSAPSRVATVTVYQSTALVTREVTVPDAAGQSEVVVTPMPPSTMPSSLYAEGNDGTRILSVRFRTRAIAEDTREDVRKLEAKLKELSKKQIAMTEDSKANTLNLAFLTKLEGFTNVTLAHLTDKGQLDAEKTITLVKFISDSRVKQVKDETALKAAMDANKEEIEFTQRLIQEKAGGVTTRTERDAVIVIDKPKAGAATVRLSYLVADANWKPQYKLRAGAKEGDKVTLEYQAALTQPTGEDWNGVMIELSTAQPCQNAAPPDLRTLEVAVGAPTPNAPAGTPATGGFGGAMPQSSAYLKDIETQAKGLRGMAAANSVQQKAAEAGKNWNDAAALEQFRDLLLSREQVTRSDLIMDLNGEGPSVVYPIRTKLTLPSRSDEHTVEIARFDLAPKFYYKAVPVLTPHVFRIAELVNTTELVLLPGEATMYLGKDFVGQAKMPLVAVGKAFTAGFGVDAQLQVSRKLKDKTRTLQGGNQVLKFNYEILLSSYKSGPVDVQVWDRLPHAEAAQTIAITIVSEKPKLSDDPLYVRDEKPKNLLRWDVKIDPKQNGEKALVIDYEYRLELDRNINIGGFQAK